MTMPKHSVMIAGHRTSISLEREFWILLKGIAEKKKTTVCELITEIDANRQGGLSSALRVFVLETLLKEIPANGESKPAFRDIQKSPV